MDMEREGGTSKLSDCNHHRAARRSTPHVRRENLAPISMKIATRSPVHEEARSGSGINVVICASLPRFKCTALAEVMG